MPLTIGTEAFQGGLAAQRPPHPFVGPLGHLVSSEAPSGIVRGLSTTVVQRAEVGRGSASVSANEAPPRSIRWRPWPLGVQRIASGPEAGPPEPEAEQPTVIRMEDRAPTEGETRLIGDLGRGLPAEPEPTVASPIQGSHQEEANGLQAPSPHAADGGRIALRSPEHAVVQRAADPSVVPQPGPPEMPEEPSAPASPEAPTLQARPGIARRLGLGPPLQEGAAPSRIQGTAAESTSPQDVQRRVAPSPTSPQVQRHAAPRTSTPGAPGGPLSLLGAPIAAADSAQPQTSPVLEGSGSSILGIRGVPPDPPEPGDTPRSESETVAGHAAVPEAPLAGPVQEAAPLIGVQRLTQSDPEPLALPPTPTDDPSGSTTGYAGDLSWPVSGPARATASGTHEDPSVLPAVVPAPTHPILSATPLAVSLQRAPAAGAPSVGPEPRSASSREGAMIPRVVPLAVQRDVRHPGRPAPTVSLRAVSSRVAAEPLFGGRTAPATPAVSRLADAGVSTASAPAVVARFPSPGDVALALGIADRGADGSVVFASPGGTRHDGAPASPPPEPPALPSVQRAEVPAPAAAPAAGPPAAGGAPSADLDELARKLYPKIRPFLKKELWLDRERAGLLTDSGR